MGWEKGCVGRVCKARASSLRTMEFVCTQDGVGNVGEASLVHKRSCREEARPFRGDYIPSRCMRSASKVDGRNQCPCQSVKRGRPVENKLQMAEAKLGEVSELVGGIRMVNWGPEWIIAPLNGRPVLRYAGSSGSMGRCVRQETGG